MLAAVDVDLGAVDVGRGLRAQHVDDLGHLVGRAEPVHRDILDDLFRPRRQHGGIDFGPRGGRVNAIAPGEIDTAMLSPGTEKIVEHIPMHRLGTPDEVAKIIYVLCTDTSSYVNGAEIHINGGQHV